VMAVTGLVVPLELETEAQLLFERYGGFGRGFDRRCYRLNCGGCGREVFHLRAGRFGTGANMAFRRSLFARIGGFDPALDVGTVTNGGGDLEMFFRVLQEGHTLVYEPSALVRHRHRRDYAQLRAQITNFGVGFQAYLVRSAIAYPQRRFAIACFGLWWLWRRSIRRLLLSLIHPSPVARDLILAELRGSLIGLGRYHKAQRMATRIAQTFGPIAPVAPLDTTSEPVGSTKPSVPLDGTHTR
jgi:O-antigen biosynthesis protein